MTLRFVRIASRSAAARRATLSRHQTVLLALYGLDDLQRLVKSAQGSMDHMSGRWTRHWNERGAVIRLGLLEKVDTFDITSLLRHCTATTVGVCLRLLARSSLCLSHRCPRTRRRGTACPLVVRWLLAESPHVQSRSKGVQLIRTRNTKRRRDWDLSTMLQAVIEEEDEL